MATCDICGAECQVFEQKGPGLVITPAADELTDRPEPKGAVTQGEQTGAPTGPEEYR